MDPAALVGILVGFGAIFLSVIMEGGNPAAVVAPGPMIIVLGGTIGAPTASGLMSEASAMVKLMKNALLAKKPTPDESIRQVVSFAEKARREGLLALEEAA